MPLPTKDSAVSRSIYTLLQTIIGSIVGLFITVWMVPTVPETITKYVFDNLPPILLLVGLPAGLTSLIVNLIRKDVKNY